MAFRYVTEIENKNGIKETSVLEVDKEEILLGRGTSSDIPLLGRRVSLNHAVLRVREDQLVIEDLDSLSGLLVNDSLVKRQALKVGDEVSIGRFCLKVVKVDGVWGFLEQRCEEEEEEDLDTFIASQEKRLRFQSYLPSYVVLSSIIAGLVFVFLA